LLRVKERFEWAGGVLEDGLNLGAAKLVITGNGGQRANADITSADTALRDGVVKMSTNARFINIGTLTSSGSCRLVWDGGGQPVLDSRGSLTVTDGTLTLDDFSGRFEAMVTVVPSAALRIESADALGVLTRNAIVTGGGRLQLVAGGRLYAVSSARISPGTTIELTDGMILDGSFLPLPSNILGPVPGVQRLTILGQLRWSGGKILGDVFLGSSAVLHAEGPAARELGGGMLHLTGSGVLAGPGELENWGSGSTLRNDGDLLLQSDLQSTSGQDYIIDNRGTLRVAGSGLVKLDRATLINQGTLDLTEGTTQPGRLSVEDCQFAKTTRLLVRIDDATPAAGYSQLQTYEAVTLAGQLEVAALHYTPAVGDRIEIVTAEPTTTIAGRFEAAKLPTPPPDGLFLRLDYRDNNATLRASSTVLGFDLRDPPTNADMRAFVDSATYDWVGYYLHAPCHGPSWMGRRTFLTDLGLGLAVIYVGQQTARASRCRQNTTTAVQGIVHQLLKAHARELGLRHAGERRQLPRVEILGGPRDLERGSL